MTDLHAAVTLLTRSPHLLVACDYDGTISPIVEDPMSAPPLPEAIAALRSLASLPNTSVAVVSGRSLRDLALMSRLPSEIHLVGSHGSEMDAGVAFLVPRERLDVLASMTQDLEAIAAETPGAMVEYKPSSVALHVRKAERDDAARAVAEAAAVADRYPEVLVRHGKEVLELAIVGTNKGDAIERLRHIVGATAVMFLGDDRTDEDVFAVLHGPDVGVKVGDGETKAGFRVDGPEDVVALLARLGETRRAWLFGGSVTPIERHSLLSDQRTVALVTDAGSVTWLPHPRLDSAAVFSELLGGPSAGFFSIRPDTASDVLSQRYIADSMVLETLWPELCLTDYLVCSADIARREPGRTDMIRVLTGTGPARIVFAPRPDFGRSPTQLRVDGSAVEVLGSAIPMVLIAPGVTWAIESDGHHETAVGTVTLGSDPCVVEFRLGTRETTPHRLPESEQRALTNAYWQEWAAELGTTRTAPALVRRSALTIKALTFGPSGAVAAAATTSLPEELGGIRNWDYRYCWLRDAALAVTALARLGSLNEGVEYLDWVASLIDRHTRPEQLQPVYSLDGGTLAPEAVIAELSGYAGSRPVRVGNAADHQVQLDVFGPIAALIDLLDRSGADLTDRHFILMEQMADAVLRRWHEPDHGIWEERTAAHHHVYSKVMCWFTLDRAIDVFRRRNIGDHASLGPVRDHIRDEVLDRGWNPQIGSFTGRYDSDDIGAAPLFVGLAGLLPADDPRFASTIRSVETVLRKGPIVWRYRHEDGLPGREGGFLLCSLWLAEAYLRSGRTLDAVDLFDQVRGLAGPTGLFSEQYDPVVGVALGNAPQTYSHHGLIDMALYLDGVMPAETEVRRRGPGWLRSRFHRGE